MDIVTDVTLAFRVLLRRPALSLTAVFTLTLALAYNIASASIVNALLLRPYPYRSLGQVLLIRDARPREGAHEGSPIANGDFMDLQRMVPAFSKIAAFRARPIVVTGGGGDPESIEGTAVSGDFFDVLGVTPLQGRTLGGGDDRQGRDDVVVFSRRFWKSRFGGMPVLGSTVSLNGRSTTVVGIISDDQCYPSGADAWVPLALPPADVANRSEQHLLGIGRLRSGATESDARAQLAAAADRLAGAYPLTNRGRGFTTLPLRREQYEFTAPLFLFVQAAALGLLTLAIVNVANLLVARTLDRGHELAVRRALGASRLRVCSMIAAEALAISALSAALSAGLSVWLIAGVRASLPDGIARWVAGWYAIRLDAAALGVDTLLALASGVAIAAVTALTALNSSQGDALRQSGRTQTARTTLMRRAIIAGEVSIAAALLLGAAVMMQGVARVSAVFGTLGPARLLRFTVTLPPARYSNDLRIVEFHQRLLDAARSLPDVEAVALIRNEPASNVSNPVSPFRIDGRGATALSDLPTADQQVISPEATSLLRMDVTAGRGFRDADRAAQPLVALVSREAVRRFWPNGDAVGSTIRIGIDATAPPVTVVGIVSDLKLNWYDPQPRAVIYRPDAQTPARTTTVMVRTGSEPIELARPLRAAISRIDDRQPISSLEPFTTTVSDSLSPLRIIALLLLAAGALSALLAATGIYGVLSQWVSSRRHELGIRLALGANRWSIARMVVGEAAATAVVGIVIAVPLAVAAVLLYGRALLGVPAAGPGTIAAVVAGAALLTLCTSAVPATAAARVDPATLLKDDR